MYYTDAGFMMRAFTVLTTSTFWLVNTRACDSLHVLLRQRYILSDGRVRIEYLGQCQSIYSIVYGELLKTGIFYVTAFFHLTRRMLCILGRAYGTPFVTIFRAVICAFLSVICTFISTKVPFLEMYFSKHSEMTPS